MREDYIRNDYHKPSDEVRPDWDLSGAVEDLELYLGSGTSSRRATRWPQWKPGAEWKPLRDAMMKAAR